MLAAWGQALVALALTGVGCVGSGVGVPDPVGAGGDVPGSAAEILALLDVRCGQRCHKGGAAPKGLSLEPTRAFAQLVGVYSAEVPTMLRVAPGQPEQSYLIAKLAATDARRVASRMPRGGPDYLTRPQIRAIEAWIAAGARADWVASQDLPDATGPGTVAGRSGRPAATDGAGDSSSREDVP